MSMIRLAILIAVLGFIADQSSKWFILISVMDPPRVIEVTFFFDLVLVFNRGVSFGLFNEASGWQPIVFTILAMVVSGGLFYWLRKNPDKWLALSVGLIVSGALGNALDRMVHGAVVDFLSFHWESFYWPAFNIADSAIFVGVVTMILRDLLFAKGQMGKKERSEKGS